MKRTALACAAFALIAISAYAQTVKPFVVPSARMSALGGPHAASSAGLDAIFENPAGFLVDTTQLGVSALVLNPSGPIFDIASLIVGGSTDILAGLTGLLDANGRLFVQADLLGPLAFGYVGKGLGFGLYNRTVLTINVASLLSTAYDVSEEFLLAGGYAYRFTIGERQKLDVGIMPKGFIRASLGQTMSLQDVVDLMSAPGSLLTGQPYTMTSGVGFDIGARWSLDDSLAVGLVAHDAYSPSMVTTYASFGDFAADPTNKIGSEYAVVPATLSVGLAYDPRLELLDRFGANLKLLLDYVDLLDLFAIVPRNPILNITAGMELELLDILSIRAGVKDALPTAGFGIDLSAFTFSLSMFGTELGLEPGARPTFNLLVAFDFRY